MSVPLYKVGEDHFCIIVGLGLIGSFINRVLNVHFETIEVEDFSVNWNSTDCFENFLINNLRLSDSSRLDVIWSAGRAGFSADDDQMCSEFDFFYKIAEFFKSRKYLVQYHHLSSAGGIYENSKLVRSVDQVSPSRPYGVWKLRQEGALKDLGLTAKNYRISSVYGAMVSGGRQGLINTIVSRVYSGQAVSVFGNQNTMRDYILNLDVAKFILEQVMQGLEEKDFIVASGRPVSIDSLIHFVRRFTNRPVHVNYIDDFQNSNDIIFSRSVIPGDLAITSLEEGIRLLCAHRAG